MAVIVGVADPGSRCRQAWSGGLTGLAVVGVLSAFVFIGWSTDTVVFAIAASIGGSAQFTAGMAQGLGAASLVVAVLDRSLRVGLLVLAVCGYVAGVGPATLVLLLLIAGTSPPVTTYLSGSGEVRTAESPVPEPLRPVDLTVEELCLAWRRSFIELSSCRTDTQRLAVVNSREAVLAELELRDPHAFMEWLDSGPRAAGNPMPYFTHQPH
ncbi:hypothetical protein ACQHIV_24510 [Kribbella sp. GL6]|uniref:hypothetical protein n=1 Tax=Kribbella sp. GL6 TaxID=3419765 RepID=UPI003CFF258B